MQTEIDQKGGILPKIEENFRCLGEQFDYVKKAVTFLESILSKYPATTFISFNGGKDATIVLVLTYLALKNISSNIAQSQNTFNQANLDLRMPEAIYFQEPNPFPEMVQFLEQMVSIFNIKIHKLPSKKYAAQLTKFSLDRHLECTIMGSRKDDPWCGHLGLVAQSDIDKGYPAFKRINPIIQWEYDQVWPVIKALEIPYCKLYNEGYSSLGNKNNTVINPTLLAQNNCYRSPQTAKPETQRYCRVTDHK